jgi:hypothetical protein
MRSDEKEIMKEIIEYIESSSIYPWTEYFEKLIKKAKKLTK